MDSNVNTTGNQYWLDGQSDCVRYVHVGDQPAVEPNSITTWGWSGVHPDPRIDELEEEVKKLKKKGKDKMKRGVYRVFVIDPECEEIEEFYVFAKTEAGAQAKAYGLSNSEKEFDDLVLHVERLCNVPEKAKPQEVVIIDGQCKKK